MTNKVNIGDKIKVCFNNPSIIGEGEIGSVETIQLIDGEIYYTLSLDNGFENKPCNEDSLPVQFVQVTEGQYELISKYENK